MKCEKCSDLLAVLHIDIYSAMLYNNIKFNRNPHGTGGIFLEVPIRYFVINQSTDIMHIYGFCQQTKSRSVPIRLFDSQKELERHSGKALTLCKACRRELEAAR